MMNKESFLHLFLNVFNSIWALQFQAHYEIALTFRRRKTGIRTWKKAKFFWGRRETKIAKEEFQSRRPTGRTPEESTGYKGEEKCKFDLKF